ncbi:MAG TPA: electron transport complex subunit RsxD [Candidatus Competibacteraceae bacterium]|nr:MAG: electron transport complex subunit RsxD [Candidatus Competibacteraceae bacterium]HOB60517.1 electron transport complex subunit RsxD [Candidatus Competibacteraceae bacterium]HQA24639.1 electron transport complex subunit RsxD [Candidatus Competibacteraceae bacterium]HQD54888.1 electron transport complex subunit RsxD [Candidatus Competibacteraceae bacterium]
MRFKTVTSPHVLADRSVGQVMRRVLYAMTPGIVALVWFFGWGVLINLALATVVALVAEAAVLTVRGKPLALYLGDYSAVTTAWLLAVALPPLAPWWLTTIGVVSAIVIAKHLYGGLGYNPFNPAMVGYVVLLISFPREMSAWLIPYGVGQPHALGLLDTLRIIMGGTGGITLDGLTGATPLDVLRTKLGLGLTVTEIRNSPVFGIVAGHGWEWATLGFLAGGLWLVFTRTAAWQIPVGMLGGLALIATIFHLVDPLRYAPPWFQVWSGAAIYGAFFIATDPVTASTTARGRLIYGAGIGVLVYIIRSFGGYPDGVAFAVLLMNIAAPTIDLYTQPRVFGARSG